VARAVLDDERGRIRHVVIQAQRAPERRDPAIEG
jgi:hypothetical protein